MSIKCTLVAVGMVSLSLVDFPMQQACICNKRAHRMVSLSLVYFPSCVSLYKTASLLPG